MEHADFPKLHPCQSVSGWENGTEETLLHEQCSPRPNQILLAQEFCRTYISHMVVLCPMHSYWNQWSLVWVRLYGIEQSAIQAPFFSLLLVSPRRKVPKSTWIWKESDWMVEFACLLSCYNDNRNANELSKNGAKVWKCPLQLCLSFILIFFPHVKYS